MVEISKETFNELFQNPYNITLDQSTALNNIIKKYPFFQVARVIELIGLKKFNNILTVGVAFSFQRHHKLPVNQNDVKLDFIITEKGIY